MEKNYYATCHNLKPSLTIIMDDGDQYFEFFMSKSLHNAMCQILINGWQLMMSTWHHGVVIMELNSSWKWVLLIELQWVAPYIRWIVTLQLMHLVC